MAVFLLILKIIGITLLCIIGLILLLLLLVLFCPIHYQIQAEYETSPKAQVDVNWLLHIFGFSFAYEEKEKTGYYRVLWMKHDLFAVKPQKKKKKSGSDVSNKEKKNLDSKEDLSYKNESDKTMAEDVQQTSLKIDTENTKKKDSKKKNQTSKKNKRNRKKHKKTGFIERMRELFHNVREIWNKIRDAIHNEVYQKAVKHIKDEVIQLLLHVLPKNMKLNLSYYTGSVDTTAELFGVIACFPVAYENKWNVYPDFDAQEKYVRGNCKLKGYIQLYVIVFAILRIIIDKNCRKLYNDFKK